MPVHLHRIIGSRHDLELGNGPWRALARRRIADAVAGMQAKRNLGFGIFEPNVFAFWINSTPALVRASRIAITVLIEDLPTPFRVAPPR
jgi:hypothetical protein